jgi:hypothetical protein
MVGGACPSGKIYLARTWPTPRTGGSRAATSSGRLRWSTSSAAAGSVVSGARPSAGVYAGDFSALGKGFVIVESNDIIGDYTVWRSGTLTGGWTATRTGVTPCSGITAEGTTSAARTSATRS